MRRYNLRRVVLGLVLALVTLSSCEDFFNVNTDDMALEENYFQEMSEIYSGLLGISAAFQQSADDYILISELLGDAVEPTINASLDFWEIYRYKPQASNPLISPTSFYKIVLNSNDYLRHIVEFNQKNPGAISKDIYKGLISTAITYRTWAYLTIGKIYGEAVYYDLALVDDTDLSKERILKLDDLVKELIGFMKQGIDGVDGFNKLHWGEIIDPDKPNESSYKDWFYQSLNADVLMCELNLWAGNYMEGVLLGLSAIESGLDDENDPSLDKYKLSGFKGKDWIKMFSQGFGTIGNEAFTAVPFDFKNNQTHCLQHYFSNIPPAVYYIKPHDNLNLSGHRHNAIDFEAGSRVVSKYHIGKKSHEQDKHIYINRAAEVWLMIAEGLSNMKNLDQADTLLNTGMQSCWDGKKFKTPFDKPIYSTNLQKNLGIRGRAEAEYLHIRDFVVDSLFTDKDILFERQKFVLDSLIANEVREELAFEGKRWFTLLRMAKNANNPAILADPISNKFDDSERELYRMWLLDSKNWFIKCDHLQKISSIEP